jgi:hypothetical protein
MLPFTKGVLDALIEADEEKVFETQVV